LTAFATSKAVMQALKKYKV